jgi:rubrerythrin
MHNGYCTKCGASNVRKQRFDRAAHGPGSDIYVCMACGYTEGYTEATELTRIASSADWEQVGPKLPSASAPPAATGATVRLNPADTNVASVQPKLRCAACGSNEIIPDVNMRDTAQGRGSITAEVERSPHALLMRGAVQSAVTAYVCGACGYLSLYANSPRLLADAHREARGGRL